MTASIWVWAGASNPLPRTLFSCALGSLRSLFSYRRAVKKRPGRSAVLAFLFGMLVPVAVLARGTYLTVPEFVANAFAGRSPPPVKTLWLSGDVQQRLNKIFDRPYQSLRVRYWQQEAKTAWVLEEIGKELPITLGIVVNAGAIEQIRVLTYRETRGAEVRHPFFTEQFEGALLGTEDVLDRRIDGITGATLSVRAVTRVAEAALVLAESVRAESEKEGSDK